MKKYSPYLGGIELGYGIEPIVVYTVGKVGSKTIVESIYALDKIPFSVYHAHVLSADIDNLTSEQEASKNFKSTDQYLRFNRDLSRYIHQNFDKHNWKVITLVREPLSIVLSSFFEFLDTGKRLQFRHPELFNNDKLQISYENFFEFFTTKFSYMTGDYVVNWFDLELKKVFGIDVYEHEFDTEKGYSVIKKDNVELLTIRLEDLNRVFEESLVKFLNIDSIKMIKENVGQERHFSNYMSFLKTNLRVRDHVCNHFYGSKFSKHFYSPQELDSLIKRWSISFQNKDTIDFEQFGVKSENIFHGLELWKKPTIGSQS